MNATEVRELSKMWTPSAGLQPTSLTCAAGEMLVVRGRSGSGKSTLLALLAGLCAPDSGSATVDGLPPGGDMPWARVAFVPQVLALAVELSVRENIVDATTTLDPAAVRASLERLDLVEFANRCVDEISMGQQQRTALARAAIVQPRVLLVDEPTSFQDGGHAGTVIEELRRLAAGGTALLVATHDEAVSAAADRVVELSR